MTCLMKSELVTVVVAQWVDELMKFLQYRVSYTPRIITLWYDDIYFQRSVTYELKRVQKIDQNECNASGHSDRM